MKLVVGLGNPGPKYETTRHNAGFLAIDRLVESWNAVDRHESHHGEVWKASREGEKILLIKPQTFMNNSGRCVAPLFNFYKCEPTDLIVIHDEIDLPPMQLRIKTGGGAGGHNGIRSLDASLGAGKTGYHRIRVGVGRPQHYELKTNPVDFVLMSFTDDDLTRLDPILDDIGEAARLIIGGQIIQAMNRFNTSKVDKPGEKG